MRYALVVILAIFSLTLFYPVYAADATASTATKLGKIENSASKAAVLKARLKLFKDQRKAAMVEKINDTLARINKNRTDSMMKNLERMSQILTKVENFINSVSGKDTTDAKKAVADAKVAIDTAKVAVDAQSKKEYTIEATSEATIRQDAKAARDSLHQDLQTTRKLVIDAKKAVANAIMVTATTVKGVKNGK